MIFFPKLINKKSQQVSCILSTHMFCECISKLCISPGIPKLFIAAGSLSDLNLIINFYYVDGKIKYLSKFITIFIY